VGTIRLIDASKPDAKEKFQQEVKALEDKGFNVLAIDFTHPSAVNGNADLYNEMKLPFVMGTTGGDRDKLMSSTQAAKNHAVIAPNMCKQIVAFQAMMEFMEKSFPGAFSGYDLSVVESHQKTKADTSGTAKAVVKSLSALTGTEFPEEKIEKIRGDDKSKAFGVPEEFLTGHAHHTYRLTSGDKSVVFEFKHNVNGRSTYAEGVADAAVFLGSRAANSRNKPKVYNMIDILKSGAMN
jgi:4-hydroxy-tetrahydrodipicolinate reductase